jgi:hypothetical protein
MSDLARIPDPHVALHRQLGERLVDAKATLARLEGTLRHIDELRAALKDAGVVVDVDLGVVGNAACQARRQLEAGAVQKFELPRGQAA